MEEWNVSANLKQNTRFMIWQSVKYLKITIILYLLFLFLIKNDHKGYGPTQFHLVTRKKLFLVNCKGTIRDKITFHYDYSPTIMLLKCTFCTIIKTHSLLVTVWGAAWLLLLTDIEGCLWALALFQVRHRIISVIPHNFMKEASLLHQCVQLEQWNIDTMLSNFPKVT